MEKVNACCMGGRGPLTKEDFREQKERQKVEQFKGELARLINKYGMENASDTPDFILVEYLFECLKAFSNTTKRRDNWYGDK